MTARTLGEWLRFVERQHPQAIALGLERVAAVRARMDLAFACPLLTVGGTNGKGSTAAMIEAILREGGYRTGLYTSPHLLRYNERVRVAGVEAADDALAQAFAAVEAARGGIALTYFEFGTLAAAWLFARERLDAVVLEVGLGGRLDAVNVFDPDCAVLASIGLDHMEYLGPTREDIGREKAGIFRAGRPAVVGDPSPPASVLDAARALGARLRLYGRDFGARAQGQQWLYWSADGRRTALAYPALRGAVQLRNAASAIAALETLHARLPLGTDAVRRGLAQVALPGRFQVLPGRPRIILDVAHNPQAAAVLAENLDAAGYAPRTVAVFGMLRDKDIAGVVRAVATRIERWHLASLGGPRGADAEVLAAALAREGVRAPSTRHARVAEALAAARGEANADDRIVVFGSFLTVAAAMAELEAVRAPGNG